MGNSRFNVFLVGGMVDGKSVVGAFQVLDAYFQLLIDPQSGVVHLSQCDRLLR